MSKKFISTMSLCLVLGSMFGQSNGLSSSPYSLYGLGLQNGLSTGKTNTLGKSGFALPSDTFINNLNPASYGGMLSNRFLMDIGIRVQNQTLYEGNDSENRFNANFSGLAFAFPLTENSGFGLTLIPFTDVGYQVLGIETPIEGSNETFISNIVGSGGLNDLNVNYGYAVNENFNVGIKGTFLFGKIEENEIDIIGESVLTIDEENFYNGFRLGFGLQYDFNEKYKFGGIINLPTRLNGDQTNSVLVEGEDTLNTEAILDDFLLPLEIGFGANFQFNKKLMFNIDYRRNFWSATNQSDSVGNFIDQDIIGIGGEYIPNSNSLDYWDRVNYRFGLNVDNGNLDIDGSRVNNYSLSIGLGLPVRKSTNTMLNFGYSYGQLGQVSNGLIKENYHLLTLNLSLEGIWFQKRLID